MKTSTRKSTAGGLAALAVAALLAGCSGGGDNSDATAADARKVPSSALASARAFSEYVGSLAATEGGETLTVDADMMPPKSETESTIAVQ